MGAGEGAGQGRPAVHAGAVFDNGGELERRARDGGVGVLRILRVGNQLSAYKATRISFAGRGAEETYEIMIACPRDFGRGEGVGVYIYVYGDLVRSDNR